jgi:phage tail tape-measure protein
MADDLDTQQSGGPPAAENIEIPPIPKETAGAVAGAAIGSMVGPAGAIIGGVVGALAGKAAASGRSPVRACEENRKKSLGDDQGSSEKSEAPACC